MSHSPSLLLRIRFAFVGSSHSTTALRGGVIAATLGAFASVGSGASDVALAFVLADPGLQAVPYSAFTIERERRIIASTEPIAACDRLSFQRDNRDGVKRVVLATGLSGRNLVLDASAPELVIACPTANAPRPTLSAAALRILRDVASPDRAVEHEQVTAQRHSGAWARSASTRGGATDTVAAATAPANLNVPVLSADRAYLVAGKRALSLTWIGGKPPFSIALRRAGERAPLFDQADIRGRHVQLPVIDLQPGRHEILVTDSTGNGFAENQLIVVEADRLPAMPATLKTATVSSDERALLFAYYLEGVDNGRWTFEALQRVATLSADFAAAAAWLSGYGEWSPAPVPR